MKPPEHHSGPNVPKARVKGGDDDDLFEKMLRITIAPTSNSEFNKRMADLLGVNKKPPVE